MKKMMIAAALIAAMAAVQAQPAPAKKALIDKVLKLQQPNIETLARAVVETPAQQMAQNANLALQRQVPAEQRETVGKGMQSDMAKYIADTVPPVKDRALALAPSTLGKVLDEKFSEAELKQLVAMLESPIYRKFGESLEPMGRALREQLVSENRSTIEAGLKALDQSWVKRLQDATPAASKTAPATSAK